MASRHDKQTLLSLQMKTKVVQHVSRITLSHLNFWILNLIFKFSNFSWFPAFVWLSDFFFDWSNIKKVMMILIWWECFLNESKKMPWTSYMVFGTSPLIPSLSWPYLDSCSFFEIFRPSSSWVIYNLKGIKRDKNSLNVKTFNILDV